MNELEVSSKPTSIEILPAMEDIKSTLNLILSGIFHEET